MLAYSSSVPQPLQALAIFYAKRRKTYNMVQILVYTTFHRTSHAPHCYGAVTHLDGFVDFVADGIRRKITFVDEFWIQIDCHVAASLFYACCMNWYSTVCVVVTSVFPRSIEMTLVR
jgi:hypothetical protein